MVGNLFATVALSESSCFFPQGLQLQSAEDDKENREAAERGKKALQPTRSKPGRSSTSGIEFNLISGPEKVSLYRRAMPANRLPCTNSALGFCSEEGRAPHKAQHEGRSSLEGKLYLFGRVSLPRTCAGHEYAPSLPSHCLKAPLEFRNAFCAHLPSFALAILLHCGFLLLLKLSMMYPQCHHCH